MKIFKKVLMVTIGIVCIGLLWVSLAMARITCDSSGCNASSGSVDFKCSKNVKIYCNSDGQTYAATSGHKSGDKAYGVTSSSSLVYYTTKTEGQEWNWTDSTHSDSSAFTGSNWHSL